MLGAFRPTASLSVGLLWKIPWRLSAPRKLRQRRRLRRVDNVVDVLSSALARAAGALNGASAASSKAAPQLSPSASRRKLAAAEKSTKLIERWKAEMPREEEMLPRDKYTMFDKKARGYRKGVHKLPKWTRVSQRVNPPGF